MGKELLNKKMTFENFVVGESNRLAHAIAVAVSENADDILASVYIYGPSGCGKTHLLMAIANEITKNNQSLKVKYVSAEKFGTDYINAVRENKTKAFRKEYRNPDILLFDDIQWLMGKEATQDEFLHTFEALYNANKLVVITSDDAPDNLKNIYSRIAVRLGSSVIACIRKPEEEELKSKIIDLLSAEITGVSKRKLNEVVRIFLDAQFDNNAEIVGAFNTVMAAIKLTDFDCAKDNIEQILYRYTERCRCDEVRTIQYTIICAALGEKSFPTPKEQSLIDFWFDVLMCKEEEVLEACRQARCSGATSIAAVDKIIKNE